MSGDVEPAMSFGRRPGTSAPHSREISAMCSSSVETTTASKSPDSWAAAIDQASRGRPASGLTFLPGRRVEPARAGTSATALTSDEPGVMVDVDGLPVGVDVEGLGAGLAPAVARRALAAEGHVRLRAVRGPVDRGHAALHARDELLAAVHARRPDRRGQA